MYYPKADKYRLYVNMKWGGGGGGVIWGFRRGVNEVVFQEDCLTLDDGTDSLSRNLGNLTTNLRRVISQNGDDPEEEVADNNWQSRDNQYCRIVEQEV
jgi:hypothetical protein